MHLQYLRGMSRAPLPQMQMADGPPPLVTSTTEEQQTLYKRILGAMNSASASPKFAGKAAKAAGGKGGKDDAPTTVHMTAAPAAGSPVAEQILSLTYGMGGPVLRADASAAAAGVPASVAEDAAPGTASAEAAGVTAKGGPVPLEDAAPAAAPAAGDARKRVAAAMRRTSEAGTPAGAPAAAPAETKTVTKFVRRRTAEGAARKTDDGAPAGGDPPTDAGAGA
jgi:hypothetical protein